jgi:hypothetical protein
LLTALAALLTALARLPVRLLTLLIVFLTATALPPPRVRSSFLSGTRQ